MIKTWPLDFDMWRSLDAYSSISYILRLICWGSGFEFGWYIRAWYGIKKLVGSKVSSQSKIITVWWDLGLSSGFMYTWSLVSLFRRFYLQWSAWNPKIQKRTIISQNLVDELRVLTSMWAFSSIYLHSVSAEALAFSSHMIVGINEARLACWVHEPSTLNLGCHWHYLLILIDHTFLFTIKLYLGKQIFLCHHIVLVAWVLWVWL